MKNKTLFNLFYEFKNGMKKDSAFEEIYNRFYKLLKKYSYTLNYSEAIIDLGESLFFISNKIPIHLEHFKEDKYILSYINKSIYHEYISLNKKKSITSISLDEINVETGKFNFEIPYEDSILEMNFLINDMIPVQKPPKFLV